MLFIALTATLVPLIATPAAQASVSYTQHRVPGQVMHGSGVDTLCYTATGFSCASGGYNGTSGQFNSLGWTPGQYWSYGSAGPNGTRHNCTSYAAYRLERNGFRFPNWTGDGGEWARQAYSHGTPVNQTPAVGSIAQWNYTADGGDVAYVEVVTSTYIETTGDAYTEGTGRQRISVGSPYWPDNFIHFKDTPIAPTASGTNHMVSGDFNGDGYSDVVAFYKGSDQTRAYVFYGSAAGLKAPVLKWTSAVGTWAWGSIKLIAGDFNHDGKADVLALYNYASGAMKGFIFYGTSTGLTAPAAKWAPSSSWHWDNISPVASDVNGDGNSDAVLFYRYDQNQTRAWVLSGTSSGLKAPVMAWDSGVGHWNWTSTKVVATDVNGDGRGDVVAFYNSGGSETKAYVFYGKSTGLAAPVKKWDSGVGHWNWTSTKLTATDVNGDGRGDVVAFYKAPNAETKVYLLSGTATGLTVPVKKWDSGVGHWNWDNTKLLAGDVKGDKLGDAVAFYNSGGSETKDYLFAGSTTGIGAPVRNWDSGLGKWNWSSM